MKIKILGYGEIGKSLAEVYRLKEIDVAWKDLNAKYGDDDCELLNVCIPYNDRFSLEVIKENMLSKPKYIIIHSTVPPGTTTQIKRFLEGKIVCHSPVIGKHPDLSESLLTFTKWFGGGNSDIYNHFTSLGMKIRFVEKPETTEIMKLWDTTYYAMCIGVNAEVKEMIEKYGGNYSDWVEYLQEYNAGYEKMGIPNVRRPYFQNLTMPIGGHCLVPNYKILSNYTDPEMLKLIKKYS